MNSQVYKTEVGWHPLFMIVEIISIVKVHRAFTKRPYGVWKHQLTDCERERRARPLIEDLISQRRGVRA